MIDDGDTSVVEVLTSSWSCCLYLKQKSLFTALLFTELLWQSSRIMEQHRADCENNLRVASFGLSEPRPLQPSSNSVVICCSSGSFKPITFIVSVGGGGAQLPWSLCGVVPGLRANQRALKLWAAAWLWPSCWQSRRRLGRILQHLSAPASRMMADESACCRRLLGLTCWECRWRRCAPRSALTFWKERTQVRSVLGSQSTLWWLRLTGLSCSAFVNQTNLWNAGWHFDTWRFEWKRTWPPDLLLLSALKASGPSGDSVLLVWT